MLSQQLVAVEVEIADQPEPGTPSLLDDCGSPPRCCRSALLTVMRTSSEPPRQARHRRTVASTSAVSVLVIDCTTLVRPADGHTGYAYLAGAAAADCAI